MAELRERVSPAMLRRRKAEVEKELPGRTVKTYWLASPILIPLARWRARVGVRASREHNTLKNFPHPALRATFSRWREKSR